MTPIVLIHGGSFAASCWDLVVDQLPGRVLAVDLPGRGRHPAPLGEVTIQGAAASVVADIDAAGFDEVVVVGHSLAGCSMPATIGLLGDRVRHAVFVAATVPPDGSSCIETLPPEIQEMARARVDYAETATMDATLARAMFGTDLDETQFSWMSARMVPEAPRLLTDRVDLAPLRSPLPRTWIRPLRDAIVAPTKQQEFVANVGDCPIIDLDTGHMCMISRPRELAALLEDIADAT